MLASFGRLVFCIGLLCLVTCVVSLRRYGSPGDTLYVAEDREKLTRQYTIINRNVDDSGSSFERTKRDVSAVSEPALQKNISIWTTHLNDSHQQLMVHWVGEGSNVIICLARDSSPRNKGGIAASSLYISYDYGKNFTNKTESFKLNSKPDSGYAQLDKFFNHPKYPEFCVFVDTTNKKLYYTSDNGRNIQRSDLNFHPSELAFDEEFPDKYVILDKVDPNKKLYLTLDGGKNFKLISIFVKSFVWSSGVDFSKAFYIERWKPNGTSTILMVRDPASMVYTEVLFEDAKDFQIKGDFMFATKQSKERNTLDLYISHQRMPFQKAEFQTELDLRKFHIADVTNQRIFISVMHTETLADLYVSEISKNFTQYKFVLSLQQILCYFPDGNWKDSWLEDVTEDPFTDLYRVEGLNGIYIASRVDSKAAISNVGPEHLISLITFDHGVTWSPINPPTEDENGKPLNCHVENSCSLHLCQKFSQLYPVTSPPGKVNTNDIRSASIMSSKSAPGIIMATGVMGKSLKGIPGVYMSRDAGLTWKRILKDYYFFNYGDHGGVLVAVKYFKSRGETRKILYSTNEGMDWNSYQFNHDELRIYGLMTEPGENTTTFTMFGSENNQHQWIIITLDLFNAFPRNCTQDDYKFWSPVSSNSTVSCVLGSRKTFQRRLAHTNCYNGINYERPARTEICECSRLDFECDYGFVHTNEGCVRNMSMKFDPYAVPADCAPGSYYKRTTGYRKIDGDMCVVSSYLSYAPEQVPCPIGEPTEFMLVALRGKIARIDLADNSTLYPVTDQNHIVAIEFDMRNNCIYWADIDLDKISRQCFNNGTVQEVVVENDLASIEGMALDWISNVLFFVDGVRKKIEAVRTDLTNEGRMRVTILDSKVLSKPRGITVHPKAGFLFWTDWDRNNPSVSRSNLDGKGVKKLFKQPIVQWPNGITIDHMSERIYWVDAMEDYIASSDLNGLYFRKILWGDSKVSHPFAIAVLKDNVYWDDWKAKSIFIADKLTGSNVITINDSFSGLMDLKVFAHFVQHGTNACSNNTKCDALCLGGPLGSSSCLCPDGLSRVNDKCVCPNGEQASANMTCPKAAGGSCDSDQFACDNGMCIAITWRCDGNNDCGDLSDEAKCPRCTYPMVSCDDDTRCYLPHWKCDGDIDCADMSDEKDCGKHNCSENQFQCKNGQCIEKKWVCDGDADCKDGSDEQNCPIAKRADPVNCSVNGFPCGNGTDAICIPSSWVCDGENDCPDESDESSTRCDNNTCAPFMFRCPSGKCIFKSWTCDGENDCGDPEESDEKDCPKGDRSKLIPRPTTELPVNLAGGNGTCLEWMHSCANGNCVPIWWQCDGINDCGDNTDELACGDAFPDTRPVKPENDARRRGCAKNQFTCSPGVCIPLAWVCDTADDCPDGGDERGCEHWGGSNGAGKVSAVCAADETPCSDGRGCVLDTQLCDGVRNCRDGSDEILCIVATRTKPLPVACNEGFIKCNNACVPLTRVCDSRLDYYDASELNNCTLSDEIYPYHKMKMDVVQSSINSTGFLISWWVPHSKNVQYQYQPSIVNVSDCVWRNMTWTNDSVYSFTDLEPYTNYTLTLYVLEIDSNSRKIHPTYKFINVTTGQGVPSPPRRVVARQMVGRSVNVVWDPPANPRGVILLYHVYHMPPPYPNGQKMVLAPPNNTSVSLTLREYFQPGITYTFWVTAMNAAYQSSPSEKVKLTFNDEGDVDDLVNATISEINQTSIFVKWHRVPRVDGYIVKVILPDNYAPMKSVTTKDTNVTLTNLPPGLLLSISISPYKGEVVGRPFVVPRGMAGEPNDRVNYTVKLKNDSSVQLTWDPPQSARYKGKELEYIVRYTKMTNYKTAAPFNNSTVLSTKNTSIVIENLQSCQTYMFEVGLLDGPLGDGQIITTLENPKAPIETLKFNVRHSTGELTVNWRATCNLITRPIQYRMVITELTHNSVSRYALPPTKNVSCEHVINSLHVGGRYNVCVSAVGGEDRCVVVWGPELEPPRGVRAYRAPNGHVVVQWQESPVQHHTVKNDERGLKYQVIVSEKEIPVDLLHPTEDMKVEIAKSSPLLMAASNGVSPLYVSVRTSTDDGYFSELSEVQTLEMEEAEADMSTEKSTAAVWWGGAMACIACVALVAALVHVALKHRRLARSFLRFTEHTPRYDSRSDHATIEHDDDDVPPIQGFSDDEPLVIA